MGGGRVGLLSGVESSWDAGVESVYIAKPARPSMAKKRVTRRTLFKTGLR